ncbi:hypothetical protein RIF29_27546 [Crotalaria pallida]|uniref:Uncharacterized protein n=1 Tax=Crotalaria pallida TaxID=3830 RepID=A0AAN9ERM7_CROPI
MFMVVAIISDHHHHLQSVSGHGQLSPSSSPIAMSRDQPPTLVASRQWEEMVCFRGQNVAGPFSNSSGVSHSPLLLTVNTLQKSLIFTSHSLSFQKSKHSPQSSSFLNKRNGAVSSTLPLSSFFTLINLQTKT